MNALDRLQGLCDRQHAVAAVFNDELRGGLIIAATNSVQDGAMFQAGATLTLWKTARELPEQSRSIHHELMDLRQRVTLIEAYQALVVVATQPKVGNKVL